jgi:hypothetical protein
LTNKHFFVIIKSEKQKEDKNMMNIYEIWAEGEEIATFTDRAEAVAEYNKIKGNYKEISLFTYKVKAE